MARTTKKIPFEQAAAELEEVVAALEKGDISLDEMLEKYTKGVKLLALCNEQLTKTEAAIDKLLTEENGKVKKEPLVIEEE